MYKSVIFLFILLLTLSACSSASGPYKPRYVSKKYDRVHIIDKECYYSADNDNFIELVERDSLGKTIIKTLSKDSVLISTETVDNEKDKNLIGESRFYYQNGKVKRVINYGKKNSYAKVKTYYPNGVLKRDDEYLNDSLVKGTCFDNMGNVIPHFIYEIEAQIDGKRLGGSLVYPEKFKREGVEEALEVKIFVNKNRKVCAIKYDSGNADEFTQEVIRCIKELNNDPNNFITEPYKRDGEAINCWMTIPMKFRLR